MSDIEEVSEVGEELVTRAAAIDIAKASAVVCTRVPDEKRPGRRVQRTWTVGAGTTAILELGDHLRCLGVERVVMEATGTYWKAFFYLLESCGIECWLVNARDVKNVPVARRPTSWTRYGCANSTSGACCVPRSCRRARSASCGT